MGFPLAILLAWAYEITPQGIIVDDGTDEIEGQNASKKGWSSFIVAGLILLGTGISFSAYLLASQWNAGASLSSGNSQLRPQQEDFESRVRRYSVILENLDRRMAAGISADIAVSPDGSRLVFSIVRGNNQLLYLKEVNQLEPQLIAESRTNLDYSNLFFSPDGEWIAFNEGYSLMKMSVHGGTAQILAEDMHIGSGGYWAKDGSIIYTSDTDLSLHKIPEAGGESVKLHPLATSASGEIQVLPQLLDGGEYVLFTESLSSSFVNGRIRVLNLLSGEKSSVIESAYGARYVQSGHILFMRADSLWAVPFDLPNMTITGAQVPVIRGIETNTVSGRSALAISEQGMLVYMKGSDISDQRDLRDLVWVDIQGRQQPLELEGKNYRHPQISPNGEQISITIAEDNGSTDVWVYDINRLTLNRRTFTGTASRAIWSPDSRQLVFDSNGEEKGLWSVNSDGTGQPELITESSTRQRAESFSEDGSILIYREGIAPLNIFRLDLSQQRQEIPLIQSSYSEGFSSVSPDGKWIAYSSNETGKYEVFVRPFPNIDDGKWLVSRDGGVEPRWAHTVDRLFYRIESNNAILSVPIDTEDGFFAGTPEPLFSGNFLGFSNRPSYDVSRNGQRFLMIKRQEETGVMNSLVIVENWFVELAELATSDATQ